jgi:hypothetical protein
MSSSALVMPDFSESFEVITDASDFAHGAILLQEGKAVAYESRVLYGVEKDNHITNKVQIAVIHAQKKLEMCLRRLNLQDDHRS